MAEKARESRIEWQTDVPIFRNSLILKQLGIAIGIPFGTLVLILLLLSGWSDGTRYALILIGALFFFSWLFIRVVYGGRYEAEFVLDKKGALCRTRSAQAKKNKVINALTVVLGMFSRNPTAMGVGMLAQSRQTAFVPWKKVDKVKYDPRGRVVLLRGGWMNSIALFCGPEDYERVERFVRDQTGGC